MQYAVAQFAPGDTMNVASGTYAETVTVDRKLTLIGNPHLTTATTTAALVAAARSSLPPVMTTDS
jgi:hypothetical protein